MRDNTPPPTRLPIGTPIRYCVGLLAPDYEPDHLGHGYAIHGAILDPRQWEQDDDDGESLVLYPTGWTYIVGRIDGKRFHTLGTFTEAELIAKGYCSKAYALPHEIDNLRQAQVYADVDDCRDGNGNYSQGPLPAQQD